MIRFAIARAGQGILTVVLLSLIVFAMSRVSGDPLDTLVPLDASEEHRELIARQIGLDRPVIEQYLIYIGDIATGDFGESFTHRQPVLGLFIDRFPNSLGIVIPAIILVAIVGPILGLVGATSRSRLVRRLVATLGTVGLATPVFWLAIVLVMVFGIRLNWLPAARMGGISHYVLPVLSLSLLLIAGMMRLVRSSMLDALGSDYVRFARIKGCSERRVRWKHALRNALSSGVAFLGVYLSVLVAGTITIELIFAWPGVGRLLLDGVLARNYPLVQGIIIISAGLIVVINMVFDIVHAYLDPTIRL